MADAGIRKEMVSNAVAFLTDPSVNDTPLTKKIQFLESKGMTNQEIQHAMVQSQGGSVSVSSNVNSNINSNVNPNINPNINPSINMNNNQINPSQLPPYPYYTPPPTPKNYDWKDYIIIGTTTAGLIYSTYQIVSRYVLPKVLPPSQSKLDDDKDAMEREFQRVESMLEKLENDQTEFIKRQDEKSKLIDEALIEVDAIVKATNEKNLRNEETLKYLKLEIDSIKTTLLKNLESQKSTITNELQELEKKTDNIKDSLLQLPIASPSSNNKKFDNIKQNPIYDSRNSTPPSNLLTNNRSTSSVSVPSEPSYTNLNIPPPSSVPSAKDILGSSQTKNESSATTFDDNNTITSQSVIPAWQLASSQKSNLNESQATIPAWQLAAQNTEN